MHLEWEETKKTIKSKLHGDIFEQWFEPISCVDLTDKKVVLEVPSKFFKDWFEKNYLDVLSNELKYRTQKDLEIVIQDRKEEVQKESSRKGESDTLSGSKLNDRYTFDHFVVGPSNSFAHAAALQVAKKPGKNYNPLFLYGGVGLGKTHLLHAIGHYLRQEKPRFKVLCMPADEFLRHYVNSLRTNKMEAFHQQYRNSCDIFLMDDIQFLVELDKSKEQFFHIFNYLQESQKQIVVTSDRYPDEMPKLDERLKSRLKQGLIADIQPPEIETRIAILEKKAFDIFGPDVIPAEVINFLATTIRNNIRELEGSLVRLEAYRSLTGSKIDLQTARSILKNIIRTTKESLDIPTILKITSNYFDIRLPDLKSKKRNKHVILPRQIAMYLCKKYTKATYEQIGIEFGGKDHSTVVIAVKKIERESLTDTALKQKIEDLTRSLKV